MMTPPSTRSGSTLQWAILVLGVIASFAAGLATYRSVGLYGGPTASGIHIERDPATGRRLLVHERVTSRGQRVRRTYDADDRSLRRTEIDGDGLNVAIESQPNRPPVSRVGFSSVNDGVIDAWSTSDPVTGETRVEVSTKRNGRIDRWERYRKGLLLRVDLDTNGNGKPDRWTTYENGIQIETFVDADEDGKPD